MFKNSPLFFIHFLFSFNMHLFYCNCCALLKRYKDSVLRRAQLFKNTVSQNQFFTHPTKTLVFQKKCFFWFWAISVETTSFIVLPGFHCFGIPKKLWPKQTVCTNMRVFFSLPDTNSVRQVLLKSIFHASSFLEDHLKNTIFYSCWGLFHFVFSVSLSLT